MVPLQSIVSRFDADLARITAQIGRLLAMAPRDAGAEDVVVQFAIIRLHDVWAWRVRELVVKSSIGGTITRGGVVLPRASHLPARFSPVMRLRRVWTANPQGNHWEPKWYDPAQASRCADLLGTNNRTEIRNGLGASVFCGELRAVRNLVAHRLPDSWQRFRDRLNPFNYRATPAEFALERDPVTGQTRFGRWIFDLRSALVAACQ
jgi:hypothetical protein